MCSHVPDFDVEHTLFAVLVFVQVNELHIKDLLPAPRKRFWA